ncbi:MAG: hypothetical protein UX25_C0025G0003 [Candidatus Woesebacteria bacterium GW2011_GWC2_45_9]|uniref:Uncharacterized protein n=2 Tax=Microgenomates group TaxID=1794810 RepID=A0A0G1N8X0_9BACT|nr:MAG: hypothetical protein UW61_C0028G0002 [Candidatus Curtissbacteria bacterium GW2011_GWC1_44_33]KKU16757.1 MAG: hypothetical protein UX25_C0025G0003 [Candidatus Woesebacteria bacterium GW2011_GWC2_45_9]
MTKSTGATKSDIKALKKDILEMKVEILGELKDMREEFDAHQFSHVRINDELQEHDTRLKSLESSKI